jgi:hypothetical protein
VKKSEWSDKQLEELLRQMPKIHDHRDPRDIYQNLSIKKRRIKPWVIPGFAAAAAIVLIIILVPKLMDGMQISADNSKNKSESTEQKIEIAADQNDSTVLMKKDNAPFSHQEKTGTAKIALMQANTLKTAVYQDDLRNGKVITYWIPDSEGQILIPVSKIVNNAKDKSWITLFNENMAALNEEEWGLSDYYPVKARLTLNKADNSVNVDVPRDHQYGQGSTSEANFVNVIKQDISTNSNVKFLKLSTEGQPGISLGNYGLLRKLPITPNKRRAFFRYLPKSGNKLFLVPASDKYKNIQAALGAMKTDKKGSDLKASLLPSFQIKSAFIKGSRLYLTLKENSRIKANANTLYCLEALLLTAKEFGAKTVMLSNSPLRRLGPFDLSKQIKVPIAPNLR